MYALRVEVVALDFWDVLEAEGDARCGRSRVGDEGDVGRGLAEESGIESVEDSREPRGSEV